MFGLTLGATFKVAIDIAAQQEAKGITIVVMVCCGLPQDPVHGPSFVEIYQGGSLSGLNATTQDGKRGSFTLLGFLFIRTPQRHVNKRLLISIHCRPAIT